MNRLLTTVVGTLAESWQELRVHRGRVVLSLVGVTIAVASLAVVVGFGSLAERASRYLNEEYSGRPATFSIDAAAADGRQVDQDALRTEVRKATARYGVDHASEVTDHIRMVQFPDGVSRVETKVVDPAFAEMHHVRLVEGDWLDETDRDRLAPALVVNQVFMDRLGDPDLSTRPTVRLPGAPDRTAVVVGTRTTSPYDTEPAMLVLSGATPIDTTPDPDTTEPTIPRFELWLPDHGATALAERVGHDVERALGDGTDIAVSRVDAAGSDDGLGPLRWLIAASATLVLLLGGIGLLNVSLVSVRQRIREIGVRRGIGASASRVFVAIMLENVLGTAVAGAVGVMIGAAVLGNDTVRDGITSGAEIGGAPFPVEAALIGIGSAVFVGAASGLLPALVAVRVKVIDAIRY